MRFGNQEGLRKGWDGQIGGWEGLEGFSESYEGFGESKVILNSTPFGVF